jgi:hypothetical protein
MHRLVPAWIVLGVAALAATARADRLDSAIPLGGTATSTVTRPGDVATIGFLVTQGTGRKLSFQVKLAKGSTLVPDVRLVAPDGTLFNIDANGGSVTAASTSWKAKLPDVPQSGLWRLEVRGAEGSSGAFSAKIKGKDGQKLAGSPPPVQVNGKQDIDILAGENAAVTVSAKRASGSRLTPQLTILDATGTAIGAPFVGSEAKGTLSVKGVRLPVFGKYTLRFSGANGSGGSMSYSAVTAPAKIKGTIPTAAPVVGVDALFGAPADRFAEAEPGMPVRLDGTASGASLAYRWLQVSGTTVPLTGATSPVATFTAPVTPASLAFQLSVSQNGVLSRSETVTVQVANRPIADAGRSKSVASDALVTLDGSFSKDRRGDGLAYSWRQMPGDDAAVTLSDAAAASPTFTAPAGDHTLHFGLRVDDGNARSYEDVIVIKVGAGAADVADAGRTQFVPRMASVHLSGLAAIRSSGVLDGGLQWAQVGGTAVTLAGATTPFPSFTAPRATADLVFELTVNGVAATADRVTVHVRPVESNLPAPTKGNGPLNAPQGDVTMSAAATVDPNSNQLLYRWGQYAGAPLPPASPSGQTATVTLPAGNAAYEYAVICNDGLQYGVPDFVSVRNSNYIGLPIAIAGADRSIDAFVNPAAIITLDARGSTRTDGQQGALTYQWTQISGKDWFDVANSTVVFNPTAAVASFSLPADVSSLTPTRTILFQLVVSDGTSSSLPDLISVTWTRLPTNGRPTVTAGVSDDKPIVGATVTLQGTSFDRDNDPLTYKWTQSAGPTVLLNPSSTSLTASFVAPAAGTLTFTFQADDGFDKSALKTVDVTVDQKPTARIVATPDKGSPGTQVTMDGTSSSDPEGADITYTWTQISGPPLTPPIPDPSASAITFTAPTGAVGFRLVVNDGRQNSDPAQKGFSANDPPSVTASATGTDTAIMGNTTTPAAAYGSNVTLVATPGAGGPFTYTWRQINGGNDPSITLSSTSSQSPTFQVPLPTGSTGFGQGPTVTLGVRASDGIQQSPESTLTIKLFASLNGGTLSQTQNTVYGGIVQFKCTSCHSGTGNSCPVGSGGNATGYGMGTKSAFLSNGNRNNCANTKRRLPFNGNTGQSTTNSTFWDRLSGTVTPTMPTTGSLTQTEKNIIQDWIDQGVYDN